MRMLPISHQLCHTRCRAAKLPTILESDIEAGIPTVSCTSSLPLRVLRFPLAVSFGLFSGYVRVQLLVYIYIYIYLSIYLSVYGVNRYNGNERMMEMTQGSFSVVDTMPPCVFILFPSLYLTIYL